MRSVGTAEDLAALRAALAARAASGWTLYEGAEPLAGVAPEALEIAGRPGEVVLRAPDAGRLWRVVGWEERGGALSLSVRGAFGRVGATVWIARDGAGPLGWAPDWFEEAVRRALEARWGEGSATLARRRASLVGSVRDARGRRAVVAALAPGGEEVADDLLAGGLVARDRAERAWGRPCELLVISAAPATRSLAERLAWLARGAAVRLFEISGSGMSEVSPHDQGALVDAGPALWPRPSPPVSPLAARILALAPVALRLHRKPGDATDRILLRGLECARVRGGAASFGLGRRRERLDDASWSRFLSFVEELLYLRTADAPDRNHPAYRLQSERWLASLVRDEIAVVDPLLDGTHVYEQVPARRRDSRDLIDILAVTRGGRLAVIELKAGEDRALPLQGLNYWSRVRWHHARGELTRRGYFPGVDLDPRPPLLYLAAPLFRLHASVRVVLDLLAPEVEAVVVGLNSDWRRRPRALARWKRSGVRDQGSVRIT
jgi:hypothetical protein